MIPRLQKVLNPAFLLLQSTPSFVMMPLLLLWCGFGTGARLGIVCLSCYFPIVCCLRDGLKQTPDLWMNHTSLMNPTSGRLLFFVRFPAALPHFFSGLRLAAIHAPLTVLSADWIGSGEGLGYLIMLSHSGLETELLITSVGCLIIFTFLLNKLVEWGETFTLKHFILSKKEGD